MLSAKYELRVAVLDNCLFALGGFDSTNYQSSVERLDPRVGKWVSVPRWSFASPEQAKNLRKDLKRFLAELPRILSTSNEC